VKGYGLAIMTDASRGGALISELSRRIQTAYEWDSMAEPVPRGYAPPVERTEVEIAREVREDYVGTYRLDGGVTLLVTLEDGALFVEHAREGRFPIFAESETEFFLRAANVQITFTRDESGAVDGLVLHQGGRDSLATRVR